MWQAEANTEPTLSASPATLYEQFDTFFGTAWIPYSNYMFLVATPDMTAQTDSYDL